MQGREDAKALDEVLCSLETAQSYQTIELLKQSPYEKTSIVSDEQGKRFICKEIVSDSKPHPYELLEKRPCAHTPKIYSCTRVEDELVVIMEKLNGPTLTQYVQDMGPIDSFGLLAVFEGVFQALSFLHTTYKTPVIHRDIKPDNILIVDSKAMLIDFGIARSWDKDAACDTHLMGTSGYAAPEQFGFMQTDPRSDIYALGMTLRFALTEANPGQKATIEPAELEEAIARACEFDPKRRYGSIKELAHQIDHALDAASKSRATAAHEPRTGHASSASSNAKQTRSADPSSNAQSTKQSWASDEPVPRSNSFPDRCSNPDAKTGKQAKEVGDPRKINVPKGAKIVYRVPPSKRKPTAGWRIVQAIVGVMALYTLWVTFEMQLKGNGEYGLFTAIALGLGTCGLPAYYLCDPFDLLRKKGAHDKHCIKRFFILMGIGLCFATICLCIELYALHTITVSS